MGRILRESATFRVTGDAVSISVVVAAYNETAHIGRLLESLVKQQPEVDEVVVVDDGSTDGTARVADAMGARLVSTPHRGAAHARNIGARFARGNVLVFLDGDMACCRPSSIERLVAPIRDQAATGTFTKELYVGNPDDPWARAYCLIRRLPFPRLLPDAHPDRWANFRAVRRDAFLEVGGYDDVGYGEDMTLATKLGTLAVVAPGAAFLHFNPESVAEIFENGRWIGRGHDIADVQHPWRENSPWRALRVGTREALAHRLPAALPARIAYHAGVITGLIHRRLSPRRHWK